jgi:hypothetical protein
MRQRPATAFVDRGVEDRLQPVARDGEAILECIDPLRERPLPGNERVDSLDHRVIVRQRPDFGCHAEEALRFLREAQPLALDHAQPRARRRQLRQQEVPAANLHRIEPGRIDRARPLIEHRCEPGELGDAPRLGASGLAPLLGPIIGVDIVRLVLADLERHAHVVAGDRIETVRRGRDGYAPGEEEEGEDCGDELHRVTLPERVMVGRCSPVYRLDGREGMA